MSLPQRLLWWSQRAISCCLKSNCEMIRKSDIVELRTLMPQAWVLVDFLFMRQQFVLIDGVWWKIYRACIWLQYLFICKRTKCLKVLSTDTFPNLIGASKLATFLPAKTWLLRLLFALKERGIWVERSKVRYFNDFRLFRIRRSKLHLLN